MTQDQMVIERLKIERDELRKEIDAMVAAMAQIAKGQIRDAQLLSAANALIQSQADENDSWVRQLNNRIAELEKENTKLRNGVIEARDELGDIIKLVGAARKIIAKQPDDAS